MTQTAVRWGILAPGRIARKFAAGLREAEGAELVAVGSQEIGRARAFAALFDIPRAHGSYAELAADPGVDAVYIGSPHARHEAHTTLCLQAGKHVLCEKPLALNAAQARRMIEVARDRDRVLMEALWTRFLPALRGAREQVAGGVLGDLRMVQADFGFRAAYDPADRLFAPDLGGGALLDIGIYPLNLAYLFCGPPREIHTLGTLGATGVDEEGAIVMRHEEGRISLLSCSLRTATPGRAHLLGTRRSLTLECPWWGATRFTLHEPGGGDEVFEFAHRGGGYAHEAEAFMELIRSGRRDSETMPSAESLAILETMDEIRRRWGVRYPGE
jgi:predicted dehydrogenase